MYASPVGPVLLPFRHTQASWRFLGPQPAQQIGLRPTGCRRGLTGDLRRPYPRADDNVAGGVVHHSWRLAVTQGEEGGSGRDSVCAEDVVLQGGCSIRREAEYPTIPPSPAIPPSEARG